MPDLSKMYKTNGMIMPHVGKMVETAMENKHITKAELARRLDVHPIGINRYLRQATLHAALLWKIGQVLNHNFFEELSLQFPLVKEVSVEETLKKQVEDLQKKENELYKKLLVKE
jgi:transcriptional regulator with XRE-family HTH domain